jgi:hypothetical protein
MWKGGRHIWWGGSNFVREGIKGANGLNSVKSVCGEECLNHVGGGGDSNRESERVDQSQNLSHSGYVYLT